LDSIIIIDDAKICGRAFINKKFELSGTCDRAYLRKAIHHEFSSVLLQQFDIYERPVFNDLYHFFTKVNGVNSYSNLVSSGEIDKDSEIGKYFYGDYYAMTGFENDFNVIAQHLFTDGKEIIAFIRHHPELPVTQKITAVISFYHLVHPVFSAEYFSSL
jgi:hypothetical protein